MNKIEVVEEAERLADPQDRAGAETLANDREALSEHRKNVAASGALPEPDPTGMCTDECGEVVEPERRAIGLGRCLACAKQFERVQRMHGRR